MAVAPAPGVSKGASSFDDGDNGNDDGNGSVGPERAKTTATASELAVAAVSC